MAIKTLFEVFLLLIIVPHNIPQANGSLYYLVLRFYSL